MRNNSVHILTIPLLTLLLFTGCGSPKEPLEPLSGAVKFEKITLEFAQNHLPKTRTYPPKEDIEQRLNEGIHENLMREGLLTPNTEEELLVTVYFSRVFMGEGGPAALRSDKLAPPRLGYEIRIMRGEKELRKIRKTGLTHNPGFISNVKHILMLDKGSEREDKAIQALGEQIVEEVKSFY